MGFSGALIGAALTVGGSLYTQHKAKKAQAAAEAQAREAAKRNVTVQASGAESVGRDVEAQQVGEVARQNARRRRQGMAGTVNDRDLAGSLTGNRVILGG